MPNSRDTRRQEAKIKSIAELGALAEELRQQGKSIALCHGVFDLLHLGHVRHFDAARKEADVVMVTLTADKFVNKGPGRPIFTDTMRAEMVAALAQIDWVGINHAPSAEPVLESIKPNVYIKGSDYENPEDDITDGIRRERGTVEKHGGRIVFTKDITFSSSSLINRYLDIYDPPLRDHLQRLRDAGGLDRIVQLVDKVKDYKVVFVGDTIIDEYQYVGAMAKAQKENIIATLFRNAEVFAGGVLAAANHVASFCREIEVVTALGDDNYLDTLRAALRPNVKLRSIALPKRPTTRKLRYVDPSYVRKLFEVYFMDDSTYPTAQRDQVSEAVADACKNADVVIVTDFGHGLLDSGLIDQLEKSGKFVAVNTQTNSANFGYNLITKYPRAGYICLDAPEARLAVKNKVDDVPTIITNELAKRIDCGRIVVTHGSFGCYTYSPGTNVVHIPAFTKTVVDTIGAGDAFFAVTSPLVAAGGDMDIVGFVGNAAGAMKVGIVGHRSHVEKVALVKFVTALLK